MDKPVLELTDQEFKEYVQQLEKTLKLDESNQNRVKNYVDSHKYSVGFVAKIKNKFTRYKDETFLRNEVMRLTSEVYRRAESKKHTNPHLSNNINDNLTFTETIYLSFLKNRLSKLNVEIQPSHIKGYHWGKNSPTWIPTKEEVLKNEET